jgi:hypothetical protein
MGLHPWHPDALARTEHQLRWAILQADEATGRDTRKRVAEVRADNLSKAAVELIVWADEHISGRIP